MRVTLTETIGWISCLVLTLSLGSQTYTQWKEDTSKGVSKWLYLGGLVNSTGFVVYSWLLKNWVFVVTNVIVLATNVLGVLITVRHRRRAARRARLSAAA